MKSGKAERASGVLLLPSHFFFIHRAALPVGISPEELRSFVELSLEQVSPFALNQLYYGYYLPPEASHLLIFAAYRKQLSVYEGDSWTAAELVMPDFTSVLGLARNGPTLAFLQGEQELTAVYWSNASEVPDRVLSRRIDPAAPNAKPPEQARDELRRKLGPLPDGLTTLLLDNPKGRFRDRDLFFDLHQEGEAKAISVQIARPSFLTLDVRDKSFLQAARGIQRKNRLLWSGLLLVFAAFLALGIFEVALFAGNKIMNTREASLERLRPEVEKIMQEEELAIRLEELGGERLLPFEMIGFLNEIRPSSIHFTRVTTNGLRSFQIDALTPKSQDVDTFQQRLESNASLERVEIRDLLLRAQDGRSSFIVEGTFRERLLNPFTQSSRGARGAGPSEIAPSEASASETASSAEDVSEEEEVTDEDELNEEPPIALPQRPARNVEAPALPSAAREEAEL